MCARHDLLTARLTLLDHETPQPGRLARRRRPGDPGAAAGVDHDGDSGPWREAALS